MIEFVYFDLGNILLSFDPLLACRGLGRVMGATTIEGRQALYDSGLEEEYEHGRLTSAEFAERLREFFGASPSGASDREILDSVSNMFVAIDSMEGVLQSVRDSGRRVGLLSNTCHAHWDWIQRAKFPVLDFLFDATVLSFEVGSMKPAPEIYQAAEQAAGVPTDRILFLDDRHENVEAAKSFGWNAVQCVGGEAAIAVLNEFQLMKAAS